MCIPKYTRNNDGNYGPTNRQHYYQSAEYHRRTAKPRKDKTRWCIEEGQEFHVFKIADESYWFCEESDCLFGFIYDEHNAEMIPIGENGELIAKFPNVINEMDLLHGFPIFTFNTINNTQNRPSSKLLDLLEETNQITYEYRIKIEKSRI